MIPHPPAHLLHGISGSPRLEDFTNSFPHVRYCVKHYLQQAGLDFFEFENILDFGCGVGRFLFAFESEVKPHQKLWGCDVFEECAQWCAENIKFATVKHNPINPPLPFEAGQFDLIYAASVFTHLRLDLQHLWAWEAYRVLRPGGILFMTLHGPDFFPSVYEIYRSGSAHNCEMYSFGEDGLFLYLDYRGKEGDQGQNEIASMHTPAFYQHQFSMFSHIQRFPQSMMAGGQDLYILQKPTSGNIVAQPLGIDPGLHLVGKITPQNNSSQLEVKFNLEGQRTFRVYPQLELPGFYSVEWDIEIRAVKDGQVLAQKRIIPSSSRQFGKTHYGVIQMEIPEYQGEVVVCMTATLSDRASLPKEQTVEISWNFANFA